MLCDVELQLLHIEIQRSHAGSWSGWFCTWFWWHIEIRVYQGLRIRVIWSRLYPRSKRETFHEFLGNVIKWTMGRDWWKHQVALPPENRHAVVKWSYAMASSPKTDPRVRTAKSSTAT